MTFWYGIKDQLVDVSTRNDFYVVEEGKAVTLGELLQRVEHT